MYDGNHARASKSNEESDSLHLVLSFIKPRLERHDRTRNRSDDGQPNVRYHPIGVTIKPVIDAGGYACADEPSNSNIINTSAVFEYPSVGATGRQVPKRGAGQACRSGPKE